MKYPGLFSNRYGKLQGKDWLLSVEPDDLSVFVDIGHQEAQRGRLGGLAIKEKRPRLNAEGKNVHLSNIGRVGAVVTNVRREWIKAVRDETECVFGIPF